MSRTLRTRPLSRCYMRRPRHRQQRALEEMTGQVLGGLPCRHRNRISSAGSRIADSWDDRVVSEYRGQRWHRDRA